MCSTRIRMVGVLLGCVGGLALGCGGTGPGEDAGMDVPDAGWDGGPEKDDFEPLGDGSDGDGEAMDGDGQDGSGDTDATRDPGQAGEWTGASSSAEPVLAGCLPEAQGQGTSVPLTIYLPEGAGPFPVIVFLHGFQLEAGQYAAYGEHLASWGFLTIFPQMPGGLIGGPNHRELKECLIALLDWIQQNASVVDGPLAGKAEPSRLGLAGHSMGGKISLLAATEDARPRAIFGVDPVDAAGGPIPGAPEDYPSVTPELMDRIAVPLGLLGETTNATCEGFLCQACAPAEDNFQQYYAHAASPAVQIEILGANHMSFLDDPNCGYICSACDPGTDDPARSRMLTRRYLTAFFNLFLRGQEAYRTFLAGAGMAADTAAGWTLAQSKNGF